MKYVCVQYRMIIKEYNSSGVTDRAPKGKRKKNKIGLFSPLSYSCQPVEPLKSSQRHLIVEGQLICTCPLLQILSDDRRCLIYEIRTNYTLLIRYKFAVRENAHLSEQRTLFGGTFYALLCAKVITESYCLVFRVKYDNYLLPRCSFLTFPNLRSCAMFANKFFVRENKTKFNQRLAGKLITYSMLTTKMDSRTHKADLAAVLHTPRCENLSLISVFSGYIILDFQSTAFCPS